MAEIKYEPFKELIIMDYTQYPNPEALATALSLAVAPGQPIALLWCDGIIFIPYPLPPDTDSVAKEYIEGRAYMASVSFALMPNYQSSIRVRGIEVPVIDVSTNLNMKRLARWLSENATQKKQ